MTSQKILAVALAHFAQKGYDGTSLADIAGEIGIKKPSIYSHYASKMDLLISIINEISKDYQECWQQALATTANLPAPDRLYHIFTYISLHFLQDKNKLSFWVRLWMFPPASCPLEVTQALSDLHINTINVIADIFKQGINDGLIPPGKPEDFSHAYLCLLDGFLMRATCSQNFDYKNALPQIWRCFLKGIGQ